jgi:hypothetical protein
MRTSIATSPYGQIRAAPEQAGGTLGNLDTMIAAHALARGSGMLPWSHVGSGLLARDDALWRHQPGDQPGWTGGATHPA